MKFLKRLFTFLIVAAILCSTALGQPAGLRSAIDGILRRASGHIGIAIIGPGTGDTLTFNGNDRFPMQSVFKFPLALAVLDRVDQGTFSLDQRIHLTKDQLTPNTWSPLRDKYPEANVDVTLNELLSYTVSKSDNNGCDILFGLIGGPGVVNRYIHAQGGQDISIVATEAEMHKDWSVQFRNWSSPSAMALLLQKFWNGDILSRTSTAYLRKLMTGTTTGPNKLKGLLPAEAVVAHKTGYSGTDSKGTTAATNDVGVVIFPDGRYFIIAVFVSNSSADEKTNDAVIAQIARAAWDAFSGASH